MAMTTDLPSRTSEPDFEEFRKVLTGEVPSRPVLYELFMNREIYHAAAGEHAAADGASPVDEFRETAWAFRNLGYDYVAMWTGQLCNLNFPSADKHGKSTYSLNEGVMIHDRASFEAYPWQGLDAIALLDTDELAREMPDGLKGVPLGPGGILENIIKLVGYDNLCFMLVDDPDLAKDVFDAIGSRLLRFHELAVPLEMVGAMVYNDDWGFKTQTMISPADLRRYVFPWLRRIVATSHAAGKPILMHSCGNLESLYDDLIDDVHLDAKHSWEDTILPIEQAYDQLSDRLTVLGGIDVGFLCRATPQEIYDRSRAMLDRSREKGRYALGSGNSIPTYVPPGQLPRHGLGGDRIAEVGRGRWEVGSDGSHRPADVCDL